MNFTRHILWLTLAILVSLVAAAAAQAEGGAPGVISRCSVHSVPAPQQGVLASDAHRVYVGSTSGVLSAYAAEELTMQWRLELGGEFSSGILPVDKGVVVVSNSVPNAGTSDGESALRLIGGDTGVAAWSVKVPFSERYYLGRLNGYVAAVSREGGITLFEASSGQLVSRAGPYGTLTAKPAFFAEQVAIGTSQKELIVISGAAVRPPIRIQTDRVERSLAFTEDGHLLAGDERGNVQYYAVSDPKPIWKFKTGAAVSSVRETDKGILVTSLDNFVYLISAYNGNVIWKRRLSGRIVDGGLSLGGHFIVLIYGENTGYALDLENGKVVDVMTSGEYELTSGTPVYVRNNTFALTTTGALETFAVGGCGRK